MSALIFEQVPDLNCAGFYFLRTPEELVLGPLPGRFDAGDQEGIERLAAIYSAASAPLADRA